MLSTVVAIAFFAILLLAAYRKAESFSRSDCIRCGHDNGLPGWRAFICPACGRNKTVLDSAEARKR